MKKKNVMWIIVVVIWVAACVLSTYILYLWVSPRMGGDGYFYIGSVSLAVNETNDSWNLTVVSRSLYGEKFWESKNVMYKLVCKNGSFWRENGTLASIKDSSSGYGVRWFDKDNDDHLSVGDVIFISKAGGSSGTVTHGGGYSLEIEVENTIIYESPHL